MFLQSLNNTLYRGVENQVYLRIVATPIFHEHEKHSEFIFHIPQLPPNLQMFLQSFFTCIDLYLQWRFFSHLYLIFLFLI